MPEPTCLRTPGLRLREQRERGQKIYVVRICGVGLGRDDDSLPPQLALDLGRACLTSTARTFEDNYTSMARDTTSGRMATWECKG